MPKHGSIKSTYVRCMRVLAVTCHLHFWQNDRDFLRATVVTRGWNGYRNKSQHRKSTLEKKILPPFQQGFEPATFQSRVRCSNQPPPPPSLSNEKKRKKGKEFCLKFPVSSLLVENDSRYLWQDRLLLPGSSF